MHHIILAISCLDRPDLAVHWRWIFIFHCYCVLILASWDILPSGWQKLFRFRPSVWGDDRKQSMANKHERDFSMVFITKGWEKAWVHSGSFSAWKSCPQSSQGSTASAQTLLRTHLPAVCRSSSAVSTAELYALASPATAHLHKTGEFIEPEGWYHDFSTLNMLTRKSHMKQTKAKYHSICADSDTEPHTVYKGMY